MGFSFFCLHINDLATHHTQYARKTTKNNPLQTWTISLEIRSESPKHNRLGPERHKKRRNVLFFTL